MTTTKREPSRSRFRVVLVCAAAILLAGCATRWGFGIAELPAERGWMPLPIGDWVLNDGLHAEAMSFCPAPRCASPGFAALLTFDGAQALSIERALAADPAELARAFSKPSEAEIARAKRDKKPLGRQRSLTTVSRFSDEGAPGLLVEIRARDGAKRAVSAMIFARDKGRLALAFATAADADAARRDAAAAWRSR